jgi:hypothetical protein
MAERLESVVSAALAVAGVSRDLSDVTGAFVGRLVEAISADDWQRVEREIETTILEPRAQRVALDAVDAIRLGRVVTSWLWRARE